MNIARRWRWIACSAFVLAAGAGPEAEPKEAPKPASQREVFPGVRVDLGAKVVEFDGTVPVNAHTKADLKVFLETTVCGYDSKEHESLVVTKAKPSQVHAALLLLGLKPGKPGAWKLEEKVWVGIPPTGDEVEVRFVTKNADGTEREEDAADWIVDSKNGKSLKEIAPQAKWVFAGSKLTPAKPAARAPGEAIGNEPAPAKADEGKPGPEFYVADAEGTLVGLTSFGTETIGLTVMYNPDNDKEAPEWVASREKTPEIGTKVVVRIRAKKV
ncbi:MAG: YdjY domain-containing protein [Phycisphaerales bacterium]